MTEKELLSIVETLKEFRNILLVHGIEEFTDHNNITYETIYSVSQHLQFWKSLIQEFGLSLLYINGSSNAVDDAFRRIYMAYHAHKLADTTLEEDTCELPCLE